MEGLMHRKKTITVVCAFTLAFIATMDHALAQKIGKYVFQSGKIIGEMNVADISACEISDRLGCTSAVRPIKIHLRTVNSAGNDCDVDALEDTSGRIQSQSKIDTILTIDDPKSQGKPNLSISFAGDEAVVEPSKNGSDIGCGAGVRYDGRWSFHTVATKAKGNIPATTSQSDLFARCMDAVDLGAMKNTQFAACYSAELSRKDAELNKFYSQLRIKLDPQKQKLLIQGQRNWIGYRDTWCAFEEVSDQAPSSEVNKLDCLIQLTKLQISRIKDFNP